jgi:hypothetical protein
VYLIGGLNTIIFDAEIDYSSDTFQLSRTLTWALDIFLTGESSSYEEIKQNLRLDISVKDLFLGSGRVFSPDAGNYAKSDSGYLQTIFAIGLSQSLLFYSSILLFGLQIVVKANPLEKHIGAMLLVLLFLLEIKEPFIHKYTLPLFTFVYFYIISTTRSQPLAPSGRRVKNTLISRK